MVPVLESFGSSTGRDVVPVLESGGTSTGRVLVPVLEMWYQYLRVVVYIKTTTMKHITIADQNVTQCHNCM